MSNNSYENLSWIIIDKYFKDNPDLFVRHHLDSYNDFINNKIYNIFKEKNPIKILKNQDPITKEYNLQADIFLGGLDGKKLYFGKYNKQHKSISSVSLSIDEGKIQGKCFIFFLGLSCSRIVFRVFSFNFD